MTTPSQQLSNIRCSCFKIVSNRVKRVNIGHFQLNHPEETQHCKFVSKFAQKRVNAQPPFNYLFDKIVLLQLPISCHSISKYFYTCFERSKHRPLAFELPWKRPNIVNFPPNCPLNKINCSLPNMMSKLFKIKIQPLHSTSDVYAIVDVGGQDSRASFRFVGQLLERDIDDGAQLVEQIDDGAQLIEQTGKKASFPPGLPFTHLSGKVYSATRSTLIQVKSWRQF